MKKTEYDLHAFSYSAGVQNSRSYPDGEEPAMQYLPIPPKRKSLIGKLADWLLLGEEEPVENAIPAARGSQQRNAQTAYGGPGGEQGRLEAYTYDMQAMHARLVQQALQDWQTATAYFESVSDPDLIDYAAYDMEAAKRKYMYLLNSAKKASRRN